MVNEVVIIIIFVNCIIMYDKLNYLLKRKNQNIPFFLEGKINPEKNLFTNNFILLQ